MIADQIIKVTNRTQLPSIDTDNKIALICTGDSNITSKGVIPRPIGILERLPVSPTTRVDGIQTVKQCYRKS